MRPTLSSALFTPLLALVFLPAAGQDVCTGPEVTDPVATWNPSPASVVGWTGLAPSQATGFSAGLSVTQPLNKRLSLDADGLWVQRTDDRGIRAQWMQAQTTGIGLRYHALVAEKSAVRPWAGVGVGYQRFELLEDAMDAQGNTYYLWDDGLLYAMPQPTPMPDAELPSPIERDNTFETVVEDGGRVVVPLRAGVDFQLTPRVHASVAMTAIPGMPEGWVTGQAGIGIHLGSREAHLRTIFPEEFLALGNDADGDGVHDLKDLCGGTEPGALVDKHGCPIDSDGDGVPDHRDLELHSSDMLVDADGVSMSLEAWNAMHSPERNDPSTFAIDSAVVVSELNAAQMAQMLHRVGNTAEVTERAMLLELRERVYNPQLTYRVQLGAYLAEFAPSAESYGLDNVVCMAGHQGLTLHVGQPFERVAEARAALAQAKALDHPDAFLTAYRNGERITLDEAEAYEALRAEAVAAAEATYDETRVVTFHVQLGRYSAGVPVDVLNAFLAMGGIEQRMESDGTHRYLTEGVSDEAEARRVLEDAIARGFSDAFVVAERNGEACSIAEARQAVERMHDTASHN